MDSKLPLHNTCEIGPLRKVMLHRPGRELENLMPEYLERLLFDDIPYLKIAQEEHDAFCDIMREDVCVFVADHGGGGISVLFQILRHEKVRVLFHGELFRHEGVLFSA